MISYKYKLYRSKNEKHLQATLAEACHVWNHALVLQKRYYKLYKKYATANAMQKHFTKVWHRHNLGAQSLQEVLQRQDTAYKRFFNHTAQRPPKFKKPCDFTSFVEILQQVAAKYGCTVHKIDKFFPSSKLCDCGYKNTTLKLNDRSWVCPHCGQLHDRDVLAAKNIHREGIHELESDCKTKTRNVVGLSR